MLIIDPTIIGRKYYTLDPKTVYTLRGIYGEPGARPIIIGEFETSTPIGTNPNAPTTRLVTHKLSDITFF